MYSMLVACGAHSGLLPCLSWPLILVFFWVELPSEWGEDKLGASTIEGPRLGQSTHSAQVEEHSSVTLQPHLQGVSNCLLF